MKQEVALRKKDYVRHAEAEGRVADSMEVRMALIARMQAGEITLADVQLQLKRIKASARKNGMTTRARAFREG